MDLVRNRWLETWKLVYRIESASKDNGWPAAAGDKNRYEWSVFDLIMIYTRRAWMDSRPDRYRLLVAKE